MHPRPTNHHCQPDSLVTQELVPSLLICRINNLKFIKISSASFLIWIYKVFPFTKFLYSEESISLG